jgi:O-antigen ligase
VLRGYLYIVAIVAMAVVAFVAGSILAESVAAGVGKDLTLSGRTEVWEALLPAIYEHPVFGHGVAMFRQTGYLQQYTTSIAWGPRSTHNSYIEMALNTGIPSAILWLGYCLLNLARKVLATPRDRVLRVVRVRETAIIAIVTVGAMTEAALLFGPLITWVLLLAAMGAPEDRVVERRHHPSWRATRSPVQLATRNRRVPAP